VSAGRAFKRSLLGYRRRDVEEAIAARDAEIASARESVAAAEQRVRAQRAREEQRVARLEAVATRLSECVVERQHELRAVRAELVRVRADEDGRTAALLAALDELEGVRRQARGQATRIRLRALRDAAELAARMGELGSSREEVRERLLAALTDSIERLADPERETAVDEVPAFGNGHAVRDPADLFEGLVEIEIGPLRDFSQLVGFEDAAKSIAATSEISVKRFSEGRATLRIKLKEPVELLRELEERCDLGFAVRDMGDDRLVLDVGA
jgi:hypothetical protein